MFYLGIITLKNSFVLLFFKIATLKTLEIKKVSKSYWQGVSYSLQLLISVRLEVN